MGKLIIIYPNLCYIKLEENVAFDMMTLLNESLWLNLHKMCTQVGGNGPLVILAI